MRANRRTLLQLGVVSALTQATPAFAQASRLRMFDASDYGAVGDGVAITTRPIQAAIDAAAGQGGGVVVLKPGLYLSGSLFVKSGVTLSIERGANPARRSRSGRLSDGSHAYCRR
ncbi:polygalacturonase [Brevundimonas vesicularis]|uniref:glycosyl hydrolase family 28-related protein n=1 Tax=Brevundimonas vesicularis TaxID=41276 RepID=UPI00277E0F36|nr:glycosyl hydrolase family 28-related protein [Brevundimonas vesicularis]MDQ1192166.1 polygalacturonase [Brevundimonas vesicularis]